MTATMNSPIKFKWKLLLPAIVIVIIAPDLVLWLFDTSIELLHALFELVEGVFDEVIKHLFHTDRHTTQIIVFYLMWAMILYPSYRLCIHWHRRIKGLRRMFPVWWKETKEKTKIYWHQKSLVHKCKYACGFLGMLGFSYLFLF